MRIHQQSKRLRKSCHTCRTINQLAETPPDLYGKSLLIKAVLLGGSLLPTLFAFVFLLVSAAFIWITKKWKHFAAVAFDVSIRSDLGSANFDEPVESSQGQHAL